MDAYASNETPNHAKRKRSFKYSDVNQAVWDWYIMCRNSNIPVSGSMLQEEATLIAEKLETADFVASNGWLEKFKQKYRVCNKMVAGEAGDVSKETMDKELEEPSIKSLAEALHVTDQLRHFAQFNGYQDFALAVGKASDVISSLQLLAPKRQTALTDKLNKSSVNYS